MNYTVDLNSENSFNTDQSKWHGKFKSRTIRIALCLYNLNDNRVSIALSSISAYLKKNNSNIEIQLFRMVQTTTDENYLPAGFAAYVKKWNPDLFAISVLSPHWDAVKPYLSEIKNTMPEILILIGGYQAILKSEETINFPAIDFLCDGDGEIPTSNLINYLQGKSNIPVSGLWEKLNDGSILKTPKFYLEDLTSIPFPDYTIYEVNGQLSISHLSEAHRFEKRLLPVMTGRGCVYNCTYCSNSTLRKMWPGNKKSFLRKYDVEEYIKELVRLRDKYNIEYFEFWDELFFSDMPYVYELFELYKRQVKIPFSVVSRIEVMDYELCKKAAEAGCAAIFFGLESGNEEYRRKFLKRFDKNIEVLEAAENCRKVGIKRITMNIIGMPFETKSQMLDTLELNKKIDPEFFYFFIYLPLKGTKLFEIAEDSGLLYDSLRNTHYRDGIDSEKAKMNIKQTGDSASEEEFNEVRKLMYEFQSMRVKM